MSTGRLAAEPPLDEAVAVKEIGRGAWSDQPNRQSLWETVMESLRRDATETEPSELVNLVEALLRTRSRDVPPGMFRLVVDLPLEVARAIDELAAVSAVTHAEAVRLAIATDLLLRREERAGGTLILYRRGRRYRFRRRRRRDSTGSTVAVQTTATVIVEEGDAESPRSQRHDVEPDL